MTGRPSDASGSAGHALWVPASEARASAGSQLAAAGLAVTTARDVADALALTPGRRFDMCVLDLLDGKSALASISALVSAQPLLPVVGVLDPHASATAGEAMHAGLADLLPWPFTARDVAVIFANLRDRVPATVLATDAPRPAGEPIFMASAAMRLAMEGVYQHASARSGLGLIGEPGSGRRLLARAAHRLGEGSSARPFVELDCGGCSPSELDDRLFGAADRRPSGSDRDTGERIGRYGLVAAARGGTLYLTRLTHAPGRVQTRLARLLRDREGTLADSGEVVDIDVRVIVALDPGVDARATDGELRPELLDRVAEARIDVPPLRRRREDIPLLATHLVREMTGGVGDADKKTLSRSALALMAALPWPGNGPELVALVETLVRAAPGPVIELDDLLERASLEGVAARIDAGVSLRDAKARFERECIAAVLMRHHGRMGDAAKALGIQRTNLYRKVRQLNVARAPLGARK